MRFSTLLTLIACTVAVTSSSITITRRDQKSAKAVLETLENSVDDNALVAKVNNLFEILKEYVDRGVLKQVSEEVANQIKANHQTLAPTKLTAQWVRSVMEHLI
ncbi:hypothetical protein BX661DRAFT_204681 [Kickxella alabastrina]|uniref:uncharacterized protein n=1 Tax=Kickxella alabastrina TaxID=61397 RepID=UPI00221F85D8|nr:uncharacterized protein BX661DRAFT_208105 [Kickxella alabastrina]XP_051392351.1 uncharacterized protein BX661DRAFT_204681 [Kickxella alabastrina]KAI7819654.1 hypothetical protein BX661DRAFT_208105 [Kickxella alabastrina]KAI7829909.1 hypothetical protein BX661DRAFT_204681 [Kickxella alabastrina]